MMNIRYLYSLVDLKISNFSHKVYKGTILPVDEGSFPIGE